MDLSPAKWIWLPCQRTLANTVVIFERDFDTPPGGSGRVVLTADSRYLLFVNGRRVGFGPAACDPRRLEVDTHDVTTLLRPGRNTVRVEVLYYGHGDGTWAAGAPGLLAQVWVGDTLAAATDSSWRCALDRSRKPGQYKRWYLRSLQEERDERLRPADGSPDWLPAAEIPCPADRPVLFGPSRDYATDASANLEPYDLAITPALDPREIPHPLETEVLATAVESQLVTFTRDPADWFEFRVPGAYTTSAIPAPPLTGPWLIEPRTPRDAQALTFVLPEQIVGFEFVDLTAPEGTVIELIPQESHAPDSPGLLDTHAFSWSRYTCVGGRQRFEVADYDSLRWLQVLIRGNTAPVTIHAVGVRRRVHPATLSFHAASPDPALARLLSASLNTLRNAAIEHLVDGHGRERQQYSGDVGHQAAVFSLLTGDLTLQRRYIRTWAMGLTRDGYFLDCWPAFDRLNRLAQRQLGLTPWGPILDHGVGFAFDACDYLARSGDLATTAFVYPRLARHFAFLDALTNETGLVPVEHLGVPTVWIDHDAFACQRDKTLAFNLYIAQASRDVMAVLAVCAGAEPDPHLDRADRLLAACRRRYFSDAHDCFVNNLPTAATEGPRFDDRSLAHAILMGLATPETVRRLATLDGTGLSYPANALWRFRALWHAGETAPIAHDLLHRWAPMPSVLQNNTLAEFWTPQPDSRAQWSHCAVAPLEVLARLATGNAPGTRSLDLDPTRLHPFPPFEVRIYTPAGPRNLTWTGHDATLK